MSIALEIATTDEQFTKGAELFRAYALYLGIDLEYQGFSEELRNLHGMYGPPKGVLVLAKEENCYVGVVGLREYAPGVAEMKRMFVADGFRGKGIGGKMTELVLLKAADLGYERIWLDSIRELQAALTLYRSFGFREIEAYRFNPHPNAVYMEYRIS